MGGVSAAAGLSTSGILAGGGGSGLASNQAALLGVAPGRLQMLVDLMQSFNSAEILMALMLAASASKNDDEESGSSAAALGFLAGLALAGRVAQSPMIAIDFQGNMPVSGVNFDSGVGLSIDLNA